MQQTQEQFVVLRRLKRLLLVPYYMSHMDVVNADIAGAIYLPM
jgi:hypothetical protein